MKWVAFHNGSLIPDDILRLILDQASRGLVSGPARDLLLVPDTRKGRPDAYGLRKMGRVRRKECMKLWEYSKKFQKKPTEPQKRQKRGL